MVSRTTRGRLREALLWVGAGLGVFCLVWTAVMFAFGLTPLVFTSGSMSPAIAAGDLAFAKTIEADQIGVGDVVSVENARGVRVTHRVVSVDPTDDGAVLSLKGDANATPDAEAYNVTSVERVWFSVPKAGYVVNAASSPIGMFVGGLLVAATLFLAFGRGSGSSGPRHDADGDDAGGSPEPGPQSAGPAVRSASLGVAAVALGFVGTLAAVQPTQATFTDTGTMQSDQLAAATIKPDLSCEVQGSPLGQKTATIRWTAPAASTTYTATATYAGNSTPLVVSSSGSNRTTTLSRSFLGNILNQTYTVQVQAAGPGAWTASSSVPVTVSFLGLGMDCGTPS